MIAVSDSFKKAIKNDTREIHGYVEIKYQDKTFDTEVAKIPTSSPLTTTEGIVQDNKILQKYASLENNYTLLDGSSMVWNENNLLKGGYISEDIFEDINDNEIIITNNDTTVSTKGITIYFKENLPFSFTVTMTNTDNEQIIDTVMDNQSYVYQYIFPTEMYISTVSITINDVDFPKNRLRIASVDFNLSDFYEGEELVSFDVTEEVDMSLSDLLINTCSVKLNNYPDTNGMSKFDILNPQGITAFLTENVQVKPYIGVLTELNGIEYVPMGVFYLKNWTSENSGNVSFDCEDVFGKLKNITISSDDYFIVGSYFAPALADYFTNMTGYKFELIGYGYNTSKLRHTNLFDFIQNAKIYNNLVTNSSDGENWRIVWNSNRYGIIKNLYIKPTIIDNIDRGELLQDVDYKKITLVNEVKIKKNTKSILNVDSQGYAQLSKIVEDEHTLTQEEEYIWYYPNVIMPTEVYTQYIQFSYTVVSGSGIAELVVHNQYIIYVKFTGTIGSVIKVDISNYTYRETTSKFDVFTNDVENGDTLEIDIHEYFSLALLEDKQRVADYYLKDYPPYKVSAKTIGDPSLEIGDTINIQTRYQDVNDGYKKMTITKQQFTYNGGLECNLEGVGY